MPNYLYQTLINCIPRGKVSQFVTDAIEAKLVKNKTTGNPIDDFIDYRKKLPKKNPEVILEAIDKGRQ